MKTVKLTTPLFTDWSEQYVKLNIKGIDSSTPHKLLVNGEDKPFQLTGERDENSTEIMLKMGFDKNEEKELCFIPSDKRKTSFSRIVMPIDENMRIGHPDCELMLKSPEKLSANNISGPFAALRDFPFKSQIICDVELDLCALTQVNNGPIFTDYELEYRFAENRRYILYFRCYKSDPYIEVCEEFSLRMNAELVWRLNPKNKFDHIISRDSFENETQPTVEPLGTEHPRDLLCRLQMPVLSEYFIPNNRRWFALCNENAESGEMLGVMGLYGSKWEEPVANMPEIFDKNSEVEWRSSLTSGKRYWLFYAGPVEKGFRTPNKKLTPLTSKSANTDRRFIFHKLHAEFNAFRLDEHIDLTGDALYDADFAESSCVLPKGDFHVVAKERSSQYDCLKKVLDDPDDWMRKNGELHLLSYRYILDPNANLANDLYELINARFEKWVKQFQGYRTGEHDYMKNVIGFSRYLRGMLLAYEQLRRDGALSEERVKRLNAYFAFTARRILDEGRWPLSRTWLHPDHPESVRDFYTYGGEHRPDRLVWSNSLPNFQSDPMCSLAHISALFKDHPDSKRWLRIALEDIDRQLDAYCGESGAWCESINYAVYTFSYFVITFKALKNRWGIDYFKDERVRRLASWLCRFFGPFDKRFGVRTWPGIGNSVLPQPGGEYLLCFAGELDENDSLRHDCLALWNSCASHARPTEHYPVMMSTAPAPDKHHKLKPLSSEVMDEVGVALRHNHPNNDESYLFQKIGFAKDHYEADETAFNWYAKGTPIFMDYGTYTSDVATGTAHNAVEIPDADPLRRGYLADHFFSNAVDYTRCEVPVTLKLLWGKMRAFAEVDNKNDAIDQTQTPYFYIGDKNPKGPKVWKIRQLLFIKPDYIVVFDRVLGRVPHRFNLHMTASAIQRNGGTITAKGRFDLDPLIYVQHPTEFEMETGELIPNLPPSYGGKEECAKHSQNFLRLYNQTDGIYRTLMFAREQGRDVKTSIIGKFGIKIETPEYTDLAFLNDEFIEESINDVVFQGRAGWIRRYANGTIQAALPDGEFISAFGRQWEDFK